MSETATIAGGPTAEAAIRVRGLRKVYRGVRGGFAALDGLDLEVPAGGVHGFLGPNGSGKTTTFRLLVGLARPSSGTIEVLGHPVTSPSDPVLTRVGATVSQPGFIPGFSGRRNLALLARASGVPRARVNEVLTEVGLRESASRSYRRYSLGMRQRLAIAAALLRSPDLVLLDEPTNGLDPSGVRAVRDVIQRLAAAGTTVLLSSHNLSEIQQLCSSVSIIGDGRLLVSGPVDELIGERTARTRVEIADPEHATEVLEAAGFTVSTDDGALIVAGHDHPDRIAKALADAGLYVTDMSAVRPDLESYFLELTGHPIPHQTEGEE
ncbi:MAG TPA: ABC transporter ATP-binding protein [Marmoricola sp.]